MTNNTINEISTLINCNGVAQCKKELCPCYGYNIYDEKYGCKYHSIILKLLHIASIKFDEKQNEENAATE